jgi:DNA primase large subunit
MHRQLVQKHELRHYGRLQYGLFLKATGIKIDDNIKFFLHHFRQGPNLTKLNEYQYGLEHMYGKKGNKKDYSPWGCAKLATTNAPGSGDIFGCPYRYYGTE